MLVSFLVEVIPKFKDWWSTFVWKRLTLFGLFLVVPTVWWALACFTTIQVPSPGLSCDVNGVVWALVTGLIGFMSSQGAFTVVTRELANARARNGT